MNRREPFVDVHCHLLPGLDDGAANWDDALAMAEMAAADGVGTIVATPHQLGSHAGNSAAAIRTANERLQSALERRGLPLRVLPGADVRIEPDLAGKLRRDEVLTLADRRRHVLLELPHEVYFPLERLLAELASAGLMGILSHPERNLGILNRPGLLRPLVERGCLLQLTAGSLSGTFGSRIQEFAESLVKEGLIHLVATDAHGTGTRPPVLSTAFHRVAKLAGEETAVDLCCRHPAMVAAGGAVPPGRRPPVELGRRGWFCHGFASELLAPGTI